MAFMEGKLQLIDLVAAAQLKAQRDAEKKRQQEAAGQPDYGPLGSKFYQQGEDYMVVPMGGKSPVEAAMGMTEKQPLSKTVGYISGTPGADVFKEKMATGRALLDAASRGGYGGGGGGGQPQDPYSNYAPGHLEQMNAINEYQPQQNPKTNATKDISSMLANQIMQQQLNQQQPQPIPPEISSALDYQGGIKNTNEVNQILEDRAATKQKTESINKMATMEKMVYTSPAYSQLKDQGQKSKAIKELPQFLKEAEANKIPITQDVINRWVEFVTKKKG
jgi:hypothetical protein